MKTKLLMFLIMVSIGTVVLAVNGFSAKQWQRPTKIRVASQVPAPEDEGAFRKTAPGHPTESAGYDLTCDDINPQAGTIIEHDQIGYTWYDFQQNASIGRMISATDNGYRHFSWMFRPGDSSDRYVDANCKDPAGGYLGQLHVAEGTVRAGFCNQSHLNDGTSVITYHQTGGTTSWATVLTIADGVCADTFTRHWDIPDQISDSWGEGSGWPKVEVLYDEVEGRDYVHLVMHEFTLKSLNAPQVAAYVRCYLGTSDTLLCQCYDNDPKTYKIPEGELTPDTYTLSMYDTTCSINSVVTVSPVSQRVAVVYLSPCCDRSCDYLSDVVFLESMTNGDDWVDGTAWPPEQYNLTDYGCEGYERASADLNACYDYQDSLHIIYVTAGFDPEDPGYYQPGMGRLYHWSKSTGNRLITSAIWEGTNPGSYYGQNIGKMSISAQAPIYHPEGDSVYLWTIWTQFDTADNAANGYTNGDLYGCGSSDGGKTWGQPWNLTNTKTPGCAPGECLSEHWSSLARNMYNGDLHIQYICDRDAGGAIMNEGIWTENPVMYLRLSPWDVGLAAGYLYRIEHPACWCQPPLKVIPGGSRELLLKLFSIGNLDLQYSASGDHDCIVGSYSGSLNPGDSVTLSFTIQGSGGCDDTLIDGNIVLTTNEGGQKIESLPVLAITASDYFECPTDSETFETLDNGVLRLYTNANCQEKIHDIGTFPDTTHEVFFTGGTMVATTSEGDTLVGRYLGENDQHLGARDKLYADECNMDFEPDFWILYTKNVFMHDLNPPADYKWYWWETSKQVKFFKETSPDVYKHLVIKYVTVRRHDPPSWWPGQYSFTSYEDTYIGMVEDIDCPADTFEGQWTSNAAGYDEINYIAWQRGWDYTGAHSEYNDYYCGIALADAGMSGESTIPYSSHNVRNDVYIYPQGGWGWKDAELCQLASASGSSIQDPGVMVDRSWVFTARKIDAGTDPDYEARFTVVLAVAPGGLSQLQEYIDTARAIVERERTAGGFPALCGDCNGDFVINVGDIVSVVGYLFRGQAPPKCPANRGDCNCDGVINVGDIVYLVSYLYRGGPEPKCPGIW